MRCIIIDDEPLARLGMELLVNAHPQLQLVNSLKNPLEISSYVVKEKVDLVFLDIEMPILSGLQFADIIREKTLFIFITAHPQYAIESYELSAVDYLLKPVKENRFYEAVEKALLRHRIMEEMKADANEKQEDYVMVRAKRHNFKVLLNNILYIEALKDYVVIHTLNQHFISWINLKTFHSKLPQDQFIRINKSIIINTKYINSYNNTAITVNNESFKIGKVYLDGIIGSLKNNL